MFKKFSIVLFASSLSFGVIAVSSTAYGQCSCAPSVNAAPASIMAMPSTQSSADGNRRFSYEPLSAQTIRTAPVYGSNAMYGSNVTNRPAPYFGSRVNYNSRSQTPLYLLSKPERNSGHR